MELSHLASILRENGDQVLNGVSKLSLSTKLLKDLNESFGLIIEEREALSSTFQVISTSNSKIELLLDLQFLHDFVQRTVGLKLIQDNAESCDQICINKFKNLKLLELRKVSLKNLTGLQSLRTQLQYVTCIRCVQDLKDLFISCGGDKSQAYVWSELKEAVLSYNNLESIDYSFEYVPWLQTLDISHNLISNAQAIDCLTNLKHLNLGFNHLETVPIFKKEYFRNLQILILKSNYIGDLIGLLYLDNLVTLDLSCNCLVDHETLSPLSHLAALQWLNLEGNPLSFHPQHRNITCRYLHSNTGTVKFILDKLLLTKHEKNLIGTYHPSVPSKFVRMRREHQSSVSSNISDMTNSSEVTTIAASELSRSQSIQRGKKIRDAIISETDENGEIRDDNGEINPELMKSINSVASLNLSSDHMETQKKIESLRNEYGPDWLHKQSGSIVQDILGMEKSEHKLSSTPYEEDFMTHASDIFKDKKSNNTNETVETPPDKTDITSDDTANNTFVTASESFEDKDPDLIQSESTSVCSGFEEEQFEAEEDEHPYLAHIPRENMDPEEVFVVISEKYLKERDTITGIMKSKWLLEIILSCEILSTNPTVIRIEFDTVRRNMKQREYILEDDEAKKFHREISNIMSQRPLSALNQAVYCCLKCSMQFSRDKDKSINKSDNLPHCPNPNCGSTLVYEVDDESTPTNRSIAQNNHNSIERPESPSECSIASETESNQLAQIHVTADVHMDNNASTSVPANCSAASVQESNSSHADDIPSSDTILRKYESDIEVISNPSQSSIEVLDDQFRPGRKRSSEERRTLMQPTLVTIPDVVIANATLPGLTESSSSSSFTESVCTAYDSTHHTSRPASGLEISAVIKEEQETNNKNKEPKEQKEEEKGKRIFTSLIEGLFSGPTTGTKSAKTTDDTNDIQFTFTEDFTNVDHRVKYHLYQNIFEDEHENFVWILRCVLLSLNSIKLAQGCLVLSTHKVYILHIKEHDNGDDLSSWLVKKGSYTIDRLQTVFTLPWKQGIGLEIRDVAKKIINYLCVLQDMQRTSNFLSFLASNPLPDSCDLVCVSPERPMLNLQHLLLSHQGEDCTPKDSTLCLLSIFSKCVITTTETKHLTLGVFIVTSTDLILLPDLEWLLPDSEKEPKIFASQPISNLLEMIKQTIRCKVVDDALGTFTCNVNVSRDARFSVLMPTYMYGGKSWVWMMKHKRQVTVVEISGGSLDLENVTLDFHFLDEIAGCEEVWTVQFETTDSLNTVISAVKLPWEKMFSVPMQVNHKVHSV